MPSRALVAPVRIGLLVAVIAGHSMPSRAEPVIEAAVRGVEPKVIAWRRDFHQFPELSNREVRTADRVAQHLQSLGLEVRTGIAKTGVAAVLRGGRPGPTIALRADMDALPVIEETDVPFRSTVRSEYLGQQVGVMHACGHDAHTAILMGAAEVLAAQRASLRGPVLFIFQPAEEGAPPGERGGSVVMLEEGLFDLAKPDAVVGLHTDTVLRTGQVGYRPGPMMAGSDRFGIRIRGRQTHAARPWDGVDPIVVAAQVVNALQTIVSRQVNLTANPAVVTIGVIRGGVRHNIVPDEVELIGTVRSFTPEARSEILASVQRIAENTAAASGATATMTVGTDPNPVVFNDLQLTESLLPTLRRVVGDDAVRPAPIVTTSEDFAYYGQRVPAVFLRLGVTPPGADPAKVEPNHSPRFFVDESSLAVGVQTLVSVTRDFLAGGAKR